MRPLVDPGSLLEVRGVPYDSIREGDLVVFRGEAGYICHRVLRCRREGSSRYFLTKGDGLLRPDGWIGENAIVGKVIAVDRRSVERIGFRIRSGAHYRYARLQNAVYELLFCSRWGTKVGGWRARFLSHRPIFAGFFLRCTIPWASRSAGLPVVSALKSTADR